LAAATGGGSGGGGGGLAGLTLDRMVSRSDESSLSDSDVDLPLVVDLADVSLAAPTSLRFWS